MCAVKPKPSLFLSASRLSSQVQILLTYFLLVFPNQILMLTRHSIEELKIACTLSSKPTTAQLSRAVKILLPCKNSSG